jgi:hypothetical protein
MRHGVQTALRKSPFPIDRNDTLMRPCAPMPDPPSAFRLPIPAFSMASACQTQFAVAFPVLPAVWRREAEPVLERRIDRAAGKRTVSVLSVRGESAGPGTAVADECSCPGAEMLSGIKAPTEDEVA